MSLSDDQMERLLVGMRALRERVAELEATDRESVAVVGIGCRFPGGANNRADYQRILCQNADGIIPVSAERLALWREEFPAFSPADVASLRAGFLAGHDIEQFDAKFFGIHDEEANHMDPQQRLLLEVAWEALEDAGIPPADIRGKSCGVFVGQMSDDYSERALRNRDPEHLHAYSFLGNTHSVSAGRLAFYLGVHGPTLTLDTACSSSLVAFHLAHKSLQRGECELALVGGVNLIVSPTLTMVMTRANGLSPDGRCYTFDARANGYVRGEGCGLLVLMREADARAAGLRIYARIIGSAINHDGAASSLTAPSGPAQEAMIRAALADAELEPGDVECVEAHGTGTPLGDPIEANAIHAIYAQGRTEPLTVGSAKTVLGHLDSAAGVAGITKLVLQLHSRRFFPHLNYEKKNVGIAWTDSEVRIPLEATPWKSARRIGAVSAFGMSGTNAHVIVEEAAEETVAERGEGLVREWLPLGLSGKTREALLSSTRRCLEYLKSNDDDPFDIASTSMLRRTHFAERLLVWGRSNAEWVDALTSFLEGRAHRFVSAGRVLSRKARVGLVFSGQGSQWEGMGLGLRESVAEFRRTVSELSFERELWEELGGSRLQETAVAQSAIYGVELGLWSALQRAGVGAVGAAGHSVGEIAAAVAAGALTEASATRLVQARGRAMSRLNGNGAMLAVDLDETRSAVAAREFGLDVAALNAPASATLSGSVESVARAEHELTSRGVAVRRLRVDCAFHSAQVEALQPEFRRSVGDVATAAPTMALVATGPEDGRFDTSYWSAQMRAPVRFHAAVEELSRLGANVFLEIGPHGVVSGYVGETLDEREHRAIPACRRDDDLGGFLRCLGELHGAGVGLDWLAILGGAGRVVSLPTYAWQRKRHWFTSPQRSKAQLHEHPLLHQSAPIGDGIWRWMFFGELGLEGELAYLSDHRIRKDVWLPAACMLEMALQAGHRIYGSRFDGLSDVTFERPVIVVTGTRVQLLVGEARDDRAPYVVLSQREEGAEWERHGEGLLVLGSPASAEASTLQQARERCMTDVAASALYNHVASQGIEYGPSFRGLSRAWRSDDGEVVGELNASTGEAGPYGIHPVVLDVALHTAFAARLDDKPSEVPVRVSRVRLHRRGARASWTHVRRGALGADVVVYDGGGDVIAIAEGLETASSQSASASALYRTRWEAKSDEGTAEEGARYLIVGGRELSELAAALENAGAEVALVEPKLGRTAWASHLRVSFGGVGPTAVVYGSAMTLSDEIADLEASWRIGCEQLVELVQGMVDAEMEARLFALTRGSQGPAPSRASGALVWGALATIGMEQEGLRPKLVDIGGDGVGWGAVSKEISSSDGERRVSLSSDGKRYVARQTRDATPSSDARLTLPGDRTYVVTGGTSGLGLVLAERLAARGARHLALLSRSGGGAEAEAMIVRLTAQGVSVRVLRTDASDPAGVARALEELRAHMPPVGGIVHAAGIVDDALVNHQTSERMGRVMRPKVIGGTLWEKALPEGAWLLHTTSLSGVEGNPGQVAYAAANAYLDARAHTSDRVHSVAFGAVAVGSAVAVEAQLEKLGYGLLSVSEAADAFEIAVASATSRQVVKYVRKRGTPSTTEATAAPKRTLREELSALPEAEVERRLEAWLVEVIRGLSTQLPSQPMEADIKDLGIDSLGMTSLRNTVNKELRIQFPLGALMRLPTLMALFKHLHEAVTR